MAKTALITGITGQDGAYLAELLLAKGYEVHGIKRRASSFNTERIDHLYQDPHERDVRLTLHYGDLTDATNLIRIVQQVQPDEIYNLAAQSHVAVSFETPEYTANADALGTLRLLEAIRILGLERQARASIRRPLRRCSARCSESPQTRNDAVLSALALRRRQAVCALDHGQLPRSLRHVCLQRHPLQPRVADAGRDIRVAQDHARPDAHPRGLERLSVPRQSRFAARLGPRARLRPGAVADAAAGRARGLRHRDAGSSTRCGSSSRPRPRCSSMQIEWEGSGVEERGVDAAHRARRWCESIRAISGQPRSIPCWAMRARRAQKLGWTPSIELRRAGARDGGARISSAPSAMR